MPPTLPPLLSLPPELLTHILSLLLPDPTSYHTLLALRSTHPLLTTLLPPHTMKSQHHRLSTLYFAAEVSLIVSPHPSPSPSSHQPDTWPCYICLHPLPRSSFAHTQTHASKAHGHAKARMRFCFDCGVRRGLYARGLVLRCFLGPDRVLCIKCGGLGVAAKRRTGRNPNGRVDREGQKRAQVLDYGTRDGVAFWVTDVRGFCVDCAGKLKPEVDAEDVEEVVDPAGKLEQGETDAVSSSTTYGSGRSIPGKGTGERKGRCQRCWSIDHTERPAHMFQGDQLLCQECWVQVWV